MKKLSLIPILSLLLLSWLINPAVAQKKAKKSKSSHTTLIQNLLSSVKGNVPESPTRIKKNKKEFIPHL